MKKLFLTLSLILNFTFAEAATTSCDSQDTACIAQLLSDTSDANDSKPEDARLPKVSNEDSFEKGNESPDDNDENSTENISLDTQGMENKNGEESMGASTKASSDNEVPLGRGQRKA